MTKAKTKAPQLYLGHVETPHGDYYIVSYDPADAEEKLYSRWRRDVYPGFAVEKGIANFGDLREWNGASVQPVKLGKIIESI